jgi:hypothetical protein
VTSGKRARVVLAEDQQGAPVVVGPVYTDKGVEELRALVESRPGWVVTGTARILSKAQLEWGAS